MAIEASGAALASLVQDRRTEILARWRELLMATGGGGGRIKDAELQKQCRDFLDGLCQAKCTGR